MRSSNTNAIYRPDLGIAVMEHIDSPNMGLIGPQVMPIYETPDQSSTFSVIPREVMLKLPDTSRSARGNYNRSDWNYEDGLYATKENGWEEPIDDTEAAKLNRRVPGLADAIATKRAMTIILKSQEKRISNKIFNASNFTAHAVSNEWDDLDNATPIADIMTGKLAFRAASGMEPNALIISYTTAMNLPNIAEVRDRIKYTYPGIDIANMGPVELARCLAVPKILIGGAMYDSTGKNIASTLADVWDNEYAALVRIATDSNDVQEPCVGRTFLWTEDSASNPVVEQYRNEDIRSDVFRVRHHTDECLLKSYDKDGNVVSNISAACVYLFSNITTK